MNSKPIKTVLPALCLLAVLIAAAWPGRAWAVDFEAGITIRKTGAPVSGYVFISGPKVRMDIYGREGTVITISRPDKGLTWIVNVPRKEYIEIRGLAVNPLGWRSPEQWDKLAEKKELGTDTVQGYLCDKTLYTFFDKEKGVVMEWRARKLDYIIKVILYDPKGLTTTELGRIKEGPIDEIAFEIPDGYKRVAVSDSPTRGSRQGQE